MPREIITRGGGGGERRPPDAQVAPTAVRPATAAVVAADAQPQDRQGPHRAPEAIIPAGICRVERVDDPTLVAARKAKTAEIM